MATQWISNTISGAVAGAISGAVAGAGSFAGGAVSTVGNSINGVGASIDGTIRTYGNATKDYGNAIKDWTKAPGSREGTANNPLGLSDTATGGRRAVTGPRVGTSTWAQSKKPTEAKGKPLRLTDGKAAAPKALPPPKASPAQKALPAPKKNVGAGTGGVRAVPAKTPVKSTDIKTGAKKAVAAPKKPTGGGYGRNSGASNPLGL